MGASGPGGRGLGLGRRGLGAEVQIGRAGPGPRAGAGLARGGFAAGARDLEPGVPPQGA